jgi:hypothetical protein
MPPLCIKPVQLTQAVGALRASIAEVWRRRAGTKKDGEKVTA